MTDWDVALDYLSRCIYLLISHIASVWLYALHTQWRRELGMIEKVRGATETTTLTLSIQTLHQAKASMIRGPLSIVVSFEIEWMISWGVYMRSRLINY